MKDTKRGVVLLQFAVMLFGLSGVIRRSVGASSITIAGGRVLCSSLILLSILLVRKMKIQANCRKDAGITIVAGALLAIHWTTFFESIAKGSVAIGTITFATFPLFLLLLEPVLYKEKISMKNILLSFGLMLGVFITIPEFTLSNDTTLAVFWGMVCSFTYALLTLCNRKLASSYAGIWVSFREQSVAALILIPVLLYRREPVQTQDILGILGIGIICTATAFSLFVSAQKHVSAQMAGISSGMETVYGILFAILFLHEMPGMREILGGIVILGVVTLSILLEKDQSK